MQRSCSKMAQIWKIGGEFFIRQLEGAGYIKQEISFCSSDSPKNGYAGAQIKRGLGRLGLQAPRPRHAATGAAAQEAVVADPFHRQNDAVPWRGG